MTDHQLTIGLGQYAARFRLRLELIFPFQRIGLFSSDRKQKIIHKDLPGSRCSGAIYCASTVEASFSR